jgi:hypothetical protein
VKTEEEVDVLVIEDHNEATVIEEVNVTEVVAEGASGPKGEPGDVTLLNATISKLTAVAVGGHRVVVLDANEEAVYADNTDLTHADKILGVTTGAADQGEFVTIKTYGEMIEPSFAWVQDQAVYVGTNGIMTQTPPIVGFSRIIGFPIAATKLFIDLSTPVTLL